MSDKRTFILAHETARKGAQQAIADAPAGYMVVIDEPKKKRIQEERYHTMITDYAKQVQFLGRYWDADDMKRLLVDDFADTMRQLGTPLRHDGRVSPSLDGRRIVQLGVQTREFTVKEASAFIEYLLAEGALHGVKYKEIPAER